MLNNIAYFARRRRRSILAGGAALLLASCGGGGGGGGSANGGQTPTPSVTPSPTPTTSAGCSLRQRQDWVLAQLQEWYLFPAQLDSTVNPASYTTVGTYIDALVAPARAQSKDRYFTYLTSIAEENAYYNSGATAGFGFRLGYDFTGNRVYVIEAFEGTPALNNLLDRGVELLQVQAPGAAAQSIAALMASGGPSAVISAFGPDTVGTSRTLTVRDPGGAQRTVTVSKVNYSLDPVSDRYGGIVINDGAKKVGYINLRTFISTADADLRAAFASFKAQGITELIIDLRYNGGGLISTAETFGDLMGGGRVGQIFDYITFRPEKASNNSQYAFASAAQAIQPTRVAFIGTGSTASASELLVNGMQPYLGTQMALIGGNTYGKPVGQIALDRAACDDRLRAVALKTENANHQGEYYTGLASTVLVSCRATDDIGHQLGDPNEGMIKVALDFLAGRGCTPISAAAGATASIERVGAPAVREVLVRDNPRSTIERELPGVF